MNRNTERAITILFAGILGIATGLLLGMLIFGLPE